METRIKQTIQKLLAPAVVLLMVLSARAQTLEINVKVVQQRFCVAQGVKKAKAAIQINVPAGNCDVEQMEIDWDDANANEVFKISIPSSKKDTSFIREHEYDLGSCLNDKRYNILLTSTFKASCAKAPNLAPGIILFTNEVSATVTPRSQPSCVNQSVGFDVQFCPSQNVSYTITYGDGSSGTTLNHSYANAGNYEVLVRATNVCSLNNPTVAKANVSIINAAKAVIGPDSGKVVAVRLDSAFICMDGGGIIRLDGIGSINATAYEWSISPSVDYLDKTTRNSANPKIRFLKPGNYTISLRVNNACNIWSPVVTCVHVVQDLPTLVLQTPDGICTDTRYRPSPFNKDAVYLINGRPLPASGDTLLKVGPSPYTVVVTGKLNSLCDGIPKSVSFVVGSAPDLQLLSPKRDTLLCVGAGNILLSANLTDGAWDTLSLPGYYRQNGNSYFRPTKPGTYTLTYARGTGACRKAVNAVVQAKGVTVSASDVYTCNDAPFVKLPASPAGGVWQTLTSCPGCIRGDTLLVKSIPPGRQTLTLQYSVTSADGCSATANSTVTIGQPQASFTIGNGCAGQPVKPLNSSTGAMAYNWLINSQQQSVTEKEPQFSLPAGRSTITLVAISGTCSHSISRDITITRPPADMKIMAGKLSGCSPLTMAFGLDQPQQTDVTYTWNFGNGQSVVNYTADVQTYRNTTRQPVSYTITASAANGCGQKNDVVSLTVLPQAKAEIGVDSTTVRCPPATVRFSNRSTGYTRLVTWSYGDGSPPVSNSANITAYEYKAPAKTETYTVRLSVSGTCGVDTDSVKITVYPLSTTALFELSKSVICPGEKVVFNDSSTPKPGRVVWEIDGKQLEGTRVDYAGFLRPNTTYTISQTVYPVCGGRVSYTQQIRTLQLPSGDFRLPPVTCPDQPVSITNLSDSSLKVKWDFGDGSAIDSTYSSPTHLFRGSGKTYTVTMTLTGFPVSCSAAFSRTIQTRDKPVARFTTPSAWFCADTLVMLKDSSLYASQWKWYANGRLVSSARNPELRLPRGQYDITLWVNDGTGCTDSVSRLNYIQVDSCALYVAAVFTPNGDNTGDYFNLYGKAIRRINRLTVFSRWGGQVYDGTNIEPNTQTNGWNGRLNGEPNGQELPPDDYVYVAEVEYPGGFIRRQRGVLTLLR